MNYLRYILLAAIVAALAWGGQLIVTGDSSFLPLWLARYVLPVRDYCVLAAGRKACSQKETEDRLWNLYGYTRLQGTTPAPLDLQQLSGYVDTIIMLTPNARDRDHVRGRLDALFIAAELAPEVYNRQFQAILNQVRSELPDLTPRADVLALYHQHDLRLPPTPQLYEDLGEFAKKNPKSHWGVDLFVTIAEQLRRYGFAEDAERILDLGRESYGSHPEGGRLFRTMARLP